MKVEGVGRRRTQLLDDLRKKKKILGAKGSKKMETTIYQSNISIYHKTLDLLTSSILNNNNNNNNNNNKKFKEEGAVEDIHLYVKNLRVSGDQL